MQQSVADLLPTEVTSSFPRITHDLDALISSPTVFSLKKTTVVAPRLASN